MYNIYKEPHETWVSSKYNNICLTTWLHGVKSSIWRIAIENINWSFLERLLVVITCWFSSGFVFAFQKILLPNFLHEKILFSFCFWFVFTFSPSFLDLFLCGNGYKLRCAFSFSLCNEGHDDTNVVFKLLTSSWNFMVNVKDVEDSSSTCTFHSFFSITRRRLSIDSSQLLWSLNKLLIIMILVLVYSNFYWTLSERLSMIWSQWFNDLNLQFQNLGSRSSWHI